MVCLWDGAGFWWHLNKRLLLASLLPFVFSANSRGGRCRRIKLSSLYEQMVWQNLKEEISMPWCDSKNILLRENALDEPLNRVNKTELGFVCHFPFLTRLEGIFRLWSPANLPNYVVFFRTALFSHSQCNSRLIAEESIILTVNHLEELLEL